MTSSPWVDSATGRRHGSEAGWRKTRLYVLERDRWICRLCGQPIDPALRHPHPMSAQVHHTVGGIAGNDPRYLVATHRACNLKAGEPGKTDPEPVGATRW